MRLLRFKRCPNSSRLDPLLPLLKVGFEEFNFWHRQGGMDNLLSTGPPARKALNSMAELFRRKKGGAPKPIATGADSAPRARAVRLWRCGLIHQEEKRARAIFRLTRPPRRGCVCPATGVKRLSRMLARSRDFQLVSLIVLFCFFSNRLCLPRCLCFGHPHSGV